MRTSSFAAHQYHSNITVCKPTKLKVLISWFSRTLPLSESLLYCPHKYPWLCWIWEINFGCEKLATMFSSSSKTLGLYSPRNANHPKMKFNRRTLALSSTLYFSLFPLSPHSSLTGTAGGTPVTLFLIKREIPEGYTTLQLCFRRVSSVNRHGTSKFQQQFWRRTIMISKIKEFTLSLHLSSSS